MAMFEVTLRQRLAADTVLEHQVDLAAVFRRALVPRRVPPFRCMQEEQSLSTSTLHDQWSFLEARVPP